MGRVFLGLTVLIALTLASCGGDTTANQQDVLFEIKKGENFQIVTKRLKEQKIIKNPTRFRVMAKLMMKDNEVKFGIYQIEKAERYGNLIDKFASGQTYSVKVTIPEGSSIFQIADILSSKGLITKEEFLKECSDKNHLARAGLGQKSTLEGYLYPDTYMIPVNYPADKITDLFLDHFDQVVDQDMKDKIKSKGMDLVKVLAMASIVEKEAKQEFEKPIIAGVYYNRIKKGYRLQADPTLIYALTLAGKYDGNIRHGDFTFDSRYNTYKYYGLPPTPICNPGKTSILAAIFPADVEYLYFVAKPDGSHYFSKTLEEHNKAVYQFQIIPARERRLQEKK